MVKYSHSKGFPRGFTFSEKTGFRFMKAPNAFNKCVAGKMRDRNFGSRAAVREAFTDATQECSKRGSPAKSRKSRTKK